MDHDSTPEAAQPADKAGVASAATGSSASEVRELVPSAAAPLSYKDTARAQFRTGDVLCFRGKGLFSWGIRLMTGSRYSHIGLVYRFEGRVYCLEAVGHGVRLALMSILMKHYEGGIDYFAVEGASEAERNAAISFGFQQLGKVYDRRGIVRFLRAILFKKKEITPEDPEWFCSELVAAAYDHAGCPLVELQAAYTSPADLAKSQHLRFRAALKP